MNKAKIRKLIKKEYRSQIAKHKEEILFIKGNKCYLCEFDFIDLLEIHHITPIKHGGDNSLENLTALCPTCHKMVHYLTTERHLNDGKADETEEWFNDNLSKNKKTRLFELALKAANVTNLRR